MIIIEVTLHFLSMLIYYDCIQSPGDRQSNNLLLVMSENGKKN